MIYTRRYPLAVLLSCLVFASVLSAQEDEDAPKPEEKEKPAAKKEAVEEAKPAKPVNPPVEVEGDKPLAIVIELIEDDRELNGVLLDMDDLKVDTAFGPAAIPLSKILGIRMSRSETDTTTVVLHNGDMITGKVEIKSLLIRTNWGRSELNGGNLASIFFGKNLSWKSLDLLAGPRWTLEESSGESRASNAKSKANQLAGR